MYFVVIQFNFYYVIGSRAERARIFHWALPICRRSDGNVNPFNAETNAHDAYGKVYYFRLHG